MRERKRPARQRAGQAAPAKPAELEQPKLAEPEPIEAEQQTSKSKRKREGKPS